MILHLYIFVCFVIRWLLGVSDGGRGVGVVGVGAGDDGGGGGGGKEQ